MARTLSERHRKMKEILLAEKRRLWTELRGELFAGQDKLHTQFEIPQDVGDMSIMDVLADTGLAVTEILRKKLSGMDAAERKLAQGSYGICEDCGENIGEERLRVQPYAVCCVSCQQKREGPSHPPGTTM